MLLTFNADPNVEDEKGQTPLHLAVTRFVSYPTVNFSFARVFLLWYTYKISGFNKNEQKCFKKRIFLKKISNFCYGSIIMRNIINFIGCYVVRYDFIICKCIKNYCIRELLYRSSVFRFLKCVWNCLPDEGMKFLWILTLLAGGCVSYP